MKTLRIAFDDFWGGWNPEVNYFTALLKQKYKVIVDQKNPDLAFYSVFGSSNSHRECRKIFFTGENRPPRDDLHTVLNFTFTPSADYNNYRFPLWVLYIDWFNIGTDGAMNPEHIIPFHELSYEKDEEDWELFKNSQKNKLAAFCGNSAGPRQKLLPELVKRNLVDSYGAFANNVGGRLGGTEWTKIAKMCEYRFSLCAENAIADGYVTEKLFHGLYAHTIPFYIGDTEAILDFNLNAFIFLDANVQNNLHTIEDCLSADVDSFKDQFMSTMFRNNKIAEELMPDAVLAKIEEIL